MARAYWRNAGRPFQRPEAVGVTTNTSIAPVTTRLATTQHNSPSASTKRERVVVLGSGWAGYALARDLDPKKYERIIISPRSHFVFTPLLASTTVGTLEFRSILEPVRRLQPDRFHQGWADSIDFDNKLIQVETNPDADELNSRTMPPPQPPKQSPQSSDVSTVESSTIAPKKGEMISVPYDKLIVAVGSYSQTFGIPGVREHANFLRDVGDARSIRLRVLQCFERADLPNTTDEQRRKLLHFAVVGGGPTGIEFAAELHDLVHDDLARLYPRLMPFAAITVYDVAPKVLPMFDKKLSAYAIETFRRQGIQVKTEHHLQGIRPDEDGKGGLKLKIQEYGDDEVGAGIVVWSTGLMQNPLVARLVARELRTSIPAEANTPENGSQPWHIIKDHKTGGIVTDDHLRVRISAQEAPEKDAAKDPKNAPAGSTILPDVFAIGDCAVIEREALPATAQVASQQAKYLAKALNKYGRAGTDAMATAKSFQYRNLGTLAYLGSWRAILQSEAVSDGITGRLAWVLWRGAYITRSMSIRNKIMVLIHWMMTWLFGRDISRF